MRRTPLNRRRDDDKEGSHVGSPSVGVASLLNPALVVRPKTDHRRPPDGGFLPADNDEWNSNTQRVRGVAVLVGSQGRERSRGTTRAHRGIVEAPQLAPWSKNQDQCRFLEGATGRERAVYRRLSEAIFAASIASVRVDVAALLRGIDRRGAGRISRSDFSRGLRSLDHGVSDEDLRLIASRLDRYGDKGVDIEYFIRVFVEDQQTLSGGGSAPSPSAKAKEEEEQQQEQQQQQQRRPVTLDREQRLRELVWEAGGEEQQWRLVHKVMEQSRESNWHGQGGQALRALRCGDARQTGALRRRDFEKAMRLCGVYLDKTEYTLLFELFDRDRSGDVTYDELLSLLDERYNAGGMGAERRGGGRSGGGGGGGGDGDAPWGSEGTAAGRRRYGLEQAQRKLLAGASAGAWRCFNKLRKRLSEINPPLDEQAFMAAVDFDCNNAIDLREWKLGLRKLGINIPDGELEELFMVFDSNNDGTLDSREAGFVLEVF